MIGIIISGHGNFATGMMSPLELIAGKQENLIGVDFTINDSTETLETKIKKAIDELKNCEGILFLTDIAGGSPFKTCVLLSREMENTKVVAGTNLGMLLEVSLNRDSVSVEELKNMALKSGNDSIKAYEAKSRKHASNSGI
ncbi:PTS galactosamine/N-acetylgalactosamine transporter subunit IIA [Clostridium sp. JN-1]|uniref:PTS galactosamine/N-acetylgalactosamine transporter subunit IIA n=1 Tax=Clostridium sp. JN-1 TaxID=2483110 RepID=UPI000F0B5522|nr:PTS galactosamine/N-acetylgalactosamine transporter subunit IIA [Clostridium sp. JN-1]